MSEGASQHLTLRRCGTAQIAAVIQLPQGAHMARLSYWASESAFCSHRKRE